MDFVALTDECFIGFGILIATIVGLVLCHFGRQILIETVKDTSIGNNLNVLLFMSFFIFNLGFIFAQIQGNPSAWSYGTFFYALAGLMSWYLVVMSIMIIGYTIFLFSWRHATIKRVTFAAGSQACPSTTVNPYTGTQSGVPQQ